MKQKILLLFITFLSFGFSSRAQTQFWSDTFENSTPLTGTRTPSISEFGCNNPSTAYFKRTNMAGVILSVAEPSTVYTSIQGSMFWGSMDIDRGSACTNNSISAGQKITWSGIDIAGKTGLSFKGLFAANSTAAFQGLQFANSTNGFVMDSMAVEYRIDGAGAWTKILGIYPIDGTTAAGSKFAVDTNNDRIGDGTPFGNDFIELSANIPGTGTTLELRFDIFSNNGTPGSSAIDNFRLFEAPVCTPPTISSNPPTRSICKGANTTFSVAASGATGYQWQVNTGSGFNNISDAGVYSGTTSNTLTITGATAGMNSYQYRAVAYNGDITCFKNSTSGTLNVSNISSSILSQGDPSCNTGANGHATISALGGIGSLTYDWQPAGGNAASATTLASGSYTVTITDGILCSATQVVNISAPAAISASLSSQTDVSCYGGADGAATINASGGTGSLSYSWSPSGGVAATATGLMANSYTVTVMDANTCTKTVNVDIAQPLANSEQPAVSDADETITIAPASSNAFTDGCQIIIARIVPGTTNGITGRVTGKVFVESTSGMFAEKPYIRRYYDITPAVAADAATAEVTLYFTQADFDDYNLNNPTSPSLPISTTDTENYKSNLRITQQHGSSATGAPGSYTGWTGSGSVNVLIIPTTVNYNAVAGRWEVTFSVTGFSGFFAHSGDAVLPVKLVNFKATKESESQIILDWGTVDEDPGTAYGIERGGNARNFVNIGNVNGKSREAEYSFQDKQPLHGSNYYRLKITVPDGKTSYSKMVVASSYSHNITISPTPALDVITVKVDNEEFNGKIAKVINLKGQQIYQFAVSSECKIDIHNWAAGVYLLQFPSGEVRRIVKLK